MWRLTFLFIILTFIPFGSLIAQPDILWSRILGTEGLEKSRDVFQTQDGGFVIAGYQNPESSDNSPLLLKIDQNSRVEWIERYPGIRNGLVYDAAEAADGGYYLTGSCDYLGGTNNIFMSKSDENGNLVWRQFIPDPLPFSYGITRSWDGGCAIAGKYGWLTGHDVFICGTDGGGNIIWENYIDYGGSEYARDIEIDTKYGYVIAGYAGNNKGLLIKVDNEGIEEWHTLVDDSIETKLYSVVLTSDGGYAAGGRFEINTNQIDYLIVKYDPDGNIEWLDHFGGDGQDYCGSIIQTEDGGYILGGNTYSFENHSNAYFIKTDATGNFEWESIVGYDDYDLSNDICETTDGGFISTGNSSSTPTGTYDIFIIRFGAYGEPASAGLPADCSSFQPDGIGLLSAYPNPFNAAVTLDFTLPQAGEVMISVFDVTGKEAATLFDGPHSAGTGTVTWNAENIPSGVYFARLESGGSAQTRKLLLLK